jgi:AraC-like DNA-binding protein
MLRSKKIVNNIQILRGFLSNKVYMFITITTILIQLLLFFIFFYRHDLSFFPNNFIQSGFYNDKADGGNSIIEKHEVSDTTLTMEFILKEGFVRPYVGISLQGNPNQYIDISGYNQVLIEAASDQKSNIVVHLITRIKEHLNGSGRFNNLYFSNTIELTPERKTFRLNINRFKIPDWWFDVNNLSPTKHILPDWKHFIYVDLATGLSPAVDVPRSLIIYNVKFIRNNAGTLTFMIFIQLIIMLFLSGFYFVKSVPHNPKEIIINYKPVTVNPHNENAYNYMEYINQNFHDCELSLRKISVATGINQRNIAEGIAKDFNCNVKTYISRLRINEAKRLLIETNLHISEIAYNVGFNSPSNFNRVFKNLTGQSPSEFLLNKA